MDGWQVNGLCIRYHREKRKEKTAHTLMIRKRKAQERALLEQEAGFWEPHWMRHSVLSGGAFFVVGGFFSRTHCYVQNSAIC